MTERILVLGHDDKTRTTLIETLLGAGFTPMPGDWEGFSPRSFARSKRPKLVIADADQPAAMPMADFCKLVRKCWGQAFPVLAVSRSTKFSQVSELLDAGATDVLPKNATATLIERKTTRCLNSISPAMAELTEEVPGDLLGVFLGNDRLVRLGDLVSVYGGAAPRHSFWRRMAPPDQGWKGVLTSEAVDRFVAGRPGSYLSWNRLHLFRMPPAQEYSVPEKVLLCRAGPPLRAAVDRSRLPAGADIYSLVPNEGVGAGYVACLLNSRMLDFYFNRIARVVGDGRLRPTDIRDVPVPDAADVDMGEFSRIATLLGHFGPNPQTWIDRQSKDDLWERMEELVFGLYGVGEGARNSLEAMCF